MNRSLETNVPGGLPTLANSLFILWMLVGTANTHLIASEYTFSCWQNGWRKNANDTSQDIFGIETNQFGFTLDVADFTNASMGRLGSDKSYQQALRDKASNLDDLPPVELLIVVELDGTRYQAKTCAAGQSDVVNRLEAVRLWESGRHIQHYDFLSLDFRDSQGTKLDCEARLDLVAWSDCLTINLHIAAELDCTRGAIRLGLKGEVGNWSQQSTFDGPWAATEEKTLTLTCPLSASEQPSAASVTVTSMSGRSIPVRFDPQKNCLSAAATRLSRNWKTGYTDIRDYDEFQITVNKSDSQRTIPFLLDLRPPANVTGVCPILCEADGRPTGIPIQISKNWHYEPTGSYLMTYALLPADTTKTYRLRLAYGFYGTLPSASHAQLCLVGYGGNGRWDQLAIGCWGESICFDMDMSLVDVAITDIRMLMNRRGVEGKKWNWTDAGWGGDWLNLQDEGQRKYFLNHLVTAYLSHGPCLTDVRHAGYYGANQEIDFAARIQTSRTDDYCRTFQHIRYSFLRDVSATKMSLFKLGRTHSYQTPKLAYGNSAGLIREHDVPKTVPKESIFLGAVELAGQGPHWAAFPGASETTPKNPLPNGYRGLIIRGYTAVVGGKTYRQPTISSPVHHSDPTNLDLELLPPIGVTEFSEGDSIELDLELITLPRHVDDYYGPNESFREHLVGRPSSWETTQRESEGNQLTVAVSGGNVLHHYPLLIDVVEPEVTVDISGGVGAVPISFRGLDSHRKYRLYQNIDGKRIPFDQSVHGNDFWQTDFDAASDTYKLTFNVPLDGINESQWVLAP